jgi:hypothetical protein
MIGISHSCTFFLRDLAVSSPDIRARPKSITTTSRSSLTARNIVFSLRVAAIAALVTLSLPTDLCRLYRYKLAVKSRTYVLSSYTQSKQPAKAPI